MLTTTSLFTVMLCLYAILIVISSVYLLQVIFGNEKEEVKSETASLSVEKDKETPDQKAKGDKKENAHLSKQEEQDFEKNEKSERQKKKRAKPQRKRDEKDEKVYRDLDRVLSIVQTLELEMKKVRAGNPSHVDGKRLTRDLAPFFEDMIKDALKENNVWMLEMVKENVLREKDSASELESKQSIDGEEVIKTAEQCTRSEIEEIEGFDQCKFYSELENDQELMQ